MQGRIPLKPQARLTITLCGAALATWGSFLSARYSYADWLFRQNSSRSVARAIAMDPGNGSYHAWLAELLEHEGRDGRDALDQALRLSPADSRPYLRRGLEAELTGDLPGAEKLLLQAAAIDRLLEPRLALMNFYFRHDGRRQFWRWAKEALAISYNDRTPLFDLCWRESPDAAEIAAKALPAEYGVRLQFVRFLLSKDQPEAAAALAEPLIRQAPAGDRPAFLECIERLIQSGHAEKALPLWAALGHPPGERIANPDFASFPSGVGFDWRLPANPEVTAIRISDPAALRISLSGKQDDQTELLRQTIPLTPGRRYRLQFGYRTSVPGVRLSVLDQSTPDLTPGEWNEGSLTFASGAEAAVTLTVEYRRALGVVRAEGWVELSRFRLAGAP